MSFGLCPCEFCDKPITVRHFPEAVRWLPHYVSSGGFWERLWEREGNDELVYAHRFCWKTLPEETRIKIRRQAPRNWEPKSMGRFV